MARHRERTNVPFHGTWQRIAISPPYSNASGTSTAQLAADLCDDTVHSPPYVGKEDNLAIVKWSGRPATVTVDRPTGYWPYRWYYQNCPSYWFGQPPTYSENWAGALTQALLRVQRTEPIVNLATTGLELVEEIPRLLKETARRILDKSGRLRAPKRDSPGQGPSDLAPGYLAYQWAIRPLVNDIRKMLSLQKSISERVRYHRKTHRTKRSNGGLPPLFDLVSSGNKWGYATYAPYLQWMTDNSYTEITNRCWYTAHLEPQMQLADILSEQMNRDYQLGRRSNGLETLYELLPWSWLIDYFTNLGDMIRLTNNMMPYKVTSLCIMAHLSLDMRMVPSRDYSTYYNQNVVLNDGFEKYEKKVRAVYNNPTASLAFSPILSDTQLLNLAALGVSALSGRGTVKA